MSVALQVPTSVSGLSSEYDHDHDPIPFWPPEKHPSASAKVAAPWGANGSTIANGKSTYRSSDLGSEYDHDHDPIPFWPPAKYASSLSGKPTSDGTGSTPKASSGLPNGTAKHLVGLSGEPISPGAEYDNEHKRLVFWPPRKPVPTLPTKTRSPYPRWSTGGKATSPGSGIAGHYYVPGSDAAHNPYPLSTSWTPSTTATTSGGPGTSVTTPSGTTFINYNGHLYHPGSNAATNPYPLPAYYGTPSSSGTTSGGPPKPPKTGTGSGSGSGSGPSTTPPKGNDGTTDKDTTPTDPSKQNGGPPATLPPKGEDKDKGTTAPTGTKPGSTQQTAPGSTQPATKESATELLNGRPPFKAPQDNFKLLRDYFSRITLHSYENEGGSRSDVKDGELIAIKCERGDYQQFWAYERDESKPDAYRVHNVNAGTYLAYTSAAPGATITLQDTGSLWTLREVAGEPKATYLVAYNTSLVLDVPKAASLADGAAVTLEADSFTRPTLAYASTSKTQMWADYNYFPAQPQ